MFKKLYIALFFVLASQAMLAQPFLTVELDTDKTLIGKPVHLTLTSEIDASAKYSWPVFTDTIDGLEIWDQSEIKTTQKGDKLFLKQTLELASFDSGYYVIRPIALMVNTDTFLSDPFLVQVNTVALDQEQEIYDIKAPRTVPFPWWNAILIGLGIIAVIALLFYFLKNKKPKAAPQTPIIRDTRTPLQRLTDDLSKIRNDKLWETNAKAFYSDLSEAIKTYLELEERIAALESTTQEVRPEIMGLNWKTQFKIEVLTMLEEGDMVKFAKATSSLEAQTQHLQNMETLLQFLKEEEARKAQNQNV